MSLVYNYDDPDKEWPCIGWLSMDELVSERTRCQEIAAVDPWRGGRNVVERIRNLDQQILSRVYLVENRQHFEDGTRFPNGADFLLWLENVRNAK